MKPEYVTFALFFIMFGLAIIAASLNLMVLKFMTMNTEDEKRDVQEAIQVSWTMLLRVYVRYTCSYICNNYLPIFNYTPNAALSTQSDTNIN